MANTEFIDASTAQAEAMGNRKQRLSVQSVASLGIIIRDAVATGATGVTVHPPAGGSKKSESQRARLWRMAARNLLEGKGFSVTENKGALVVWWG